MRSITYFLFAFLLIVSCSDDDTTAIIAEPTNAITPVLVTKIIEVKNGGAEKISEYFYNGNNITLVTHNDGSHEEFIYYNNRISSIRHYMNGILGNEEYFEYNSTGTLQKIKTITVNGWEWGERYSYDSFGANLEYYIIEPETEEVILSEGTSIYIEGKNIVGFVTFDDSKSFYFDEKKDPFINISGFDILTQTYALHRLGVNNVISYTQSYDPSSATTYSYNINDFPETSLEISEDGQEISRQYFYNN